MYSSLRTWIVLTAGVALCLFAFSGCGSPAAPPGGGGGGDGDPPVLDCEIEGYPCSLDEVPKDVREASRIALESAYDALLAGTMEDAAATLRARDDLADLAYDSRALRFRLEGGGPTFLQDVTGITSVAPETNGSNASSTGRASALPAPSAPTTPNAVVGDDDNGDGSKDQRDGKSALFLSPYKWQFAPFDEGDILSSNLGATPPYEGRVDYLENPTEASQNITIDDWRSWYLYDFIYVSTHGARLPSGSTTYVVISSGVIADASQTLEGVEGAWRYGMIDRDAQQSGRFIEWGLDRDFFRAAYGDGLDDTMVVFSACETGAAGAGSLAQAIGGDDFVMLGWTEQVWSNDAVATSSAFLEHLLKGLRADEAHARLVSDGLTTGDPVLPNPPPVFTRYAPNGGDQRLREIPEILDDGGARLADGADITDALSGLPGDGAPDTLTLTTRIDGVEAFTEGDYAVRYELAGVPANGSYGLDSATRVDDSTVDVTYTVDLGRDAPSGLSRLVAIVDLPEGGESRFVVEVLLAMCSWEYRSSAGIYSGEAATFSEDPTDGTYLLQLLSDEHEAMINVSFDARPPVGERTFGENGELVVLLPDPYTSYTSGDGVSCYRYSEDYSECLETMPPPPTIAVTTSTDSDFRAQVTGDLYRVGSAPIDVVATTIDLRARSSDLHGFAACGE